MYCEINYKRKKGQPVELSNITQSLIEWINRLEKQFTKEDETGLVKNIFQFSNMKEEIKKAEKNGIKSSVSFKNFSEPVESMLGLFFGNQTASSTQLPKIAFRLKNSKFNDLSIEDVNKKLKNNDPNAQKLLGLQNEFFKHAGEKPSNKIEENFFENIDNFNNILPDFMGNFNSDKGKHNIIRDLKLLCDEDKKFAKYLEVRKGTKDLLKGIENKLSEIYKEMSSKNEQLKNQYTSNKLNPKDFFEDIKKDMRIETKTAISYTELIGILEKVRSYLPTFNNIIVNGYGDLTNKDQAAKEQCIRELKSKENQIFDLSKSLEKEIKELKKLQKK